MENKSKVPKLAELLFKFLVQKLVLMAKLLLVIPRLLRFSFFTKSWQVIDRAKVLFDEISRALHQHSDKRAPSGSLNMECGNHIVDLEGILRREKLEFEV